MRKNSIFGRSTNKKSDGFEETQLLGMIVKTVIFAYYESWFVDKIKMTVLRGVVFTMKRRGSRTELRGTP